MTREITVDWPWPSEWESVEDISKFYKDRLHPALSEFVASQAEGETYIDYVQGPFTIANLTKGSVMFAGTGGVVTQDNDDLFWDATNIRLGINVGTSPSVTLDVSGDCKFDGAVTVNNSQADKDFLIKSDDDAAFFFINANDNLLGIREGTPTALVHITALAGNTVPALNLEAGANGEIVTPDGQQFRIGHWDGSSTFTERFKIDASGKVYVSYMSAGSVAFTGTGGEIKQDNSNLFWDDTNNWFGVGTASPTNLLHVSGTGTTSGWGGAYGGVVARFTANENKHSIICIDALTGYDPVLGLSENGSAMWDIRNDASATDTLNIRYQVGGANRTDFKIDNSGNIEIVSGKLSMDTAIATAIDIGNSFTGSQITTTGSSATDHALEIDGVYSAALIYTHTSSATADTLLWGDMASTATSGDFNGLRPRLACNAASGGLNARSVYGEVIVGASKYAALAQGVLGHVSYAAGSCNITDIHALGAHISQGASLTATNLYGIIATIQTRGDETISGNDYAMRLDNEAVGGNGRQMDGGIQLVNTNMGGGTYGFTYGLDLSGADIATADIILQNGEIIKNTTDGTIDFSAGNLLTTGTLGAGVATFTGLVVDSPTLVVNASGYADKVGIGTATPEYLFHIEATDNTRFLVKSTGADSNADITIQNDAKQWQLATRGDLGDAFTIRDAGGDHRFVVLPGTFRVGIGTTTPDYELHVEATDNTRLLAKSTGANSDADITLQNDVEQWQLAVRGDISDMFSIRDAGGDHRVCVLPNTGNVGINQYTFGTNAATVFAIASGTAPTSSPADCFQMYSADIGGTGGEAGAHFRDEEGNVVSIGSGGIIATANARTQKGAWIDAGGIKAPGLKPAAAIAHGALETPAWQFADEAVEANEESVSFSIRFPSDCDMTAVPAVCVGWSSTTIDDGEDSEQVEWQLEYLYTQVDEATNAAAEETLYVTSTASTTAEGLIVAQFTGMNVPNANDVCIHCKLKRLSSASAGSQTDSIADNVELHGVVLLYTANKQGTAL